MVRVSALPPIRMNTRRILNLTILYRIDIMTYFFDNIQPEKTNMKMNKEEKINNNSIQPTKNQAVVVTVKHHLILIV